MEAAHIATPKKGPVTAKAPRAGSIRSVSQRQAQKVTRSGQGSTLVCVVTGICNNDHSAIIGRIRDGLPAASVQMLEEAYATTRAEMAVCLSMSIATLRRRQKEGYLHVDESDRVVRLARIKDLALEMMQGDDAAAVEWLQTPHDLLQGEAPMYYASTEMGARDVEDLIGRIRHGVFS
jgi:putative toxin-antitoxin system antitoxin component (TIGR02293 family)